MRSFTADRDARRERPLGAGKTQFVAFFGVTFQTAGNFGSNITRSLGTHRFRDSSSFKSLVAGSQYGNDT